MQSFLEIKFLFFNDCFMGIWFKVEFDTEEFKD